MLVIVFWDSISEIMVPVVEGDGMLLICLFVYDLCEVDSIEILHIIDHLDFHNKITNKIRWSFL